MKVGNSTEYAAIEPGTYPAQLVEWTDVDQFGNPLMSMAFADREPAEQWRFKFFVEVEEGAEPRHLSTWINKPPNPENISQKAKIYELAKAILGGAADTEEWDVEDLIEGQLRVQVEVYEKKDGSEANKISKFYSKAKARRAARVVEEEDEDAVPTIAREPIGGGKKIPF